MFIYLLSCGSSIGFSYGEFQYNLSKQLTTETGLLDLYANDEIILSQHDFLKDIENIKSIKIGFDGYISLKNISAVLYGISTNCLAFCTVETIAILNICALY